MKNTPDSYENESLKTCFWERRFLLLSDRFSHPQVIPAQAGIQSNKHLS